MVRADLRWDDQVNSATQKARVAAHSIAKAFICKDTKTWANLYRTFVRPHIEYAMPAWIPYQVQHLKKLESVQRWYTRQIPGIGHLDHETRYKLCGLKSMQSRIDRGIAIETFKIVSGLGPSKGVKLQHFSHSYETRGRTDGNLEHEKPKGDVRKNSFAVRSPIIWDTVIPAVRSTTTVNGFKNSFDMMYNH